MLSIIPLVMLKSKNVQFVFPHVILLLTQQLKHKNRLTFHTIID